MFHERPVLVLRSCGESCHFGKSDRADALARAARAAAFTERWGDSGDAAPQ